jgi:glycosyltransferase involved in cell wall biosynthesis
MKTSDLVSIVIPCYNQAHFVIDAIESVFAQTHRYFEIIVIDDGSLDNIADVVGKYSDVRYFRREHSGVSAARNTGLRMGSGDYFVFLDSDDRLLPHALTTALDVFRASPSCAFVSGHIRLIAADGSDLSTPEIICIERDHYSTLLKYNYIWTPSSVMFRRSVLENMGGFNSSFSAGADWDLYLRISKIHPVLCHHQVIAEYRIHENSMNSNPALMMRDSLKALGSQRRWVRNSREHREALKTGLRGVQSYYRRSLMDEIRRLSRRGEWKRAFWSLAIFVKCDPLGFVRMLTSKPQQISNVQYEAIRTR